MEFNKSNLSEIYISLKKICNNANLDTIPMFRKGNKLVPRCESGIHIKKKNRGKFTASAKAAGQGVQEHARSVLNSSNATPLQKKRANFARNAAKWKHQQGGILQSLMERISKSSIDRLRKSGPITTDFGYKSGNYSGGRGGGGGIGTRFRSINTPEFEFKKDTLLIPYETTFNEAFSNARQAKNNEFTFQGKRYNTNIGTNPNNYTAGQQRKEVGIVPIERTRKVLVKNNIQNDK